MHQEININKTLNDNIEIKLAAAKLEDYMRESLKDSKMKSMSSIKEALTSARKNKMRVVKRYLCDSCDKNIEKSLDGFVVHGNVYVADPNLRGGLIGNNFPDPDEKNQVNIDEIKETVLCKACFCRALGIDLPVKNTSKKNWDIKDQHW
jgi:hypothetical protein